MTDRIISIDEIELSPRGRKPQLDEGLVNMFRKLQSNKAILLDESFGSVPSRDRSTVSARIRKHWAAARADKVKIDYSPDGIPQVRVRFPEAQRVLSN